MSENIATSPQRKITTQEESKQEHNENERKETELDKINLAIGPEKSEREKPF